MTTINDMRLRGRGRLSTPAARGDDELRCVQLRIAQLVVDNPAIEPWAERANLRDVLAALGLLRRIG